MVFRPVKLGLANSPHYGSRFVKIGNSGGDYQEGLRELALSGNFRSVGATEYNDWVYFLGKYEVSRGQYYAVMDPSRKLSKDEAAAAMTGVSWYEVQDFLRQYTQWTYDNPAACDRLPRFGNNVGYFRLPSEAEWEFAARGGTESSDDDYAKDHPYPGAIGKYEWLLNRGGTSRVRGIGLREPSRLGVHDMLGNVAEMTNNPYRISLYQGRIGGYTVRGGSINTPENKCRASLRREEPYWTRELKPRRAADVGFRLVIGATLMPDDLALTEPMIESFKKSEEAKSSKRASRAGVALSDSVNEAVEQAVQASNAIEGSLGDPDAAKKSLDQLRLALDQVVRQAQKNDRERATREIENAVQRILVCGRCEFLAAGVTNQIESGVFKSAKNLETVEKRRAEYNADREHAFRQYSRTMELLVGLGRSRSDLVRGALEDQVRNFRNKATETRGDDRDSRNWRAYEVFLQRIVLIDYDERVKEEAWRPIDPRRVGMAADLYKRVFE